MYIGEEYVVIEFSMSKKQKREQTDELLEKHFEGIQRILQLEVPAAAKARLIKMVTSDFDINSINIAFRTEVFLFKLLEYLGCKDAKEYISLSTSDWGENGANTVDSGDGGTAGKAIDRSTNVSVGGIINSNTIKGIF